MEFGCFLRCWALINEAEASWVSFCSGSGDLFWGNWWRDREMGVVWEEMKGRKRERRARRRDKKEGIIFPWAFGF